MFFVREAFPSNATGTSLLEGLIDAGNELAVLSEFNEGGVIFADGIEQDALDFHWGTRLSVGLATRQLALVQGPGS